jgi:hypothetical protein
VRIIEDKEARVPQGRHSVGGTMFGSHKVKIEGELLEKVKQCSEVAGYESVDEFVIHMLEKEIKKIMPPEESNTSKEDVQKRLRGLGYIE